MKKKKNISSIYIYLLVFSLILSSFFYDDLSARTFVNVTQYASASEKLDKFFQELDATSCNNDKTICTNSYINRFELITADIYNKAIKEEEVDSFLTSSISYWNNTGGVISSNNSANGSELEKHGIRAVANLKNDVKVKGDGSLDNPYTIVESDAFISGFTIDGIENSDFSEFPTRNDGFTATVECTNGTGIWDGVNWGLLITNMNSDEANCKIHFVNAPTLYQKVLSDNISQNDTALDLTSISNDNNGKGLYNTSTNTENNQIVHYFRGDVINNNVIFGKDNNGNNLYWKIVRTNEDSSVRLIYNGTKTSLPYLYEDEKVIDINYHTENGEMTINYKETKIKTKVDTWYDENLINYGNYINKNASFCIDTTEISGATKSGSTYYTVTKQYSADVRSLGNGNPQFKCNSTPITLDNGVGLLNIDEAKYAGLDGYYGASGYELRNDNTYLNKKTSSPLADNAKWWTISPLWCDSNNTKCAMGVIHGPSSNSIFEQYTTDTNIIRPVLSLKSCVYVTGGDGTFENPYSVGITNECKSTNN